MHVAAGAAAGAFTGLARRAPWPPGSLSTGCRTRFPTRTSRRAGSRRPRGSPCSPCSPSVVACSTRQRWAAPRALRPISSMCSRCRDPGDASSTPLIESRGGTRRVASLPGRSSRRQASSSRRSHDDAETSTDADGAAARARPARQLDLLGLRGQEPQLHRQRTGHDLRRFARMEQRRLHDELRPSEVVHHRRHGADFPAERIARGVAARSPGTTRACTAATCRTARGCRAARGLRDGSPPSPSTGGPRRCATRRAPRRRADEGDVGGAANADEPRPPSGLADALLERSQHVAGVRAR